MAAVLIPITRETDDTGFFDLQATLDGATYTLEFRWNVRLGAWFMNVLDSEGVNPLLVGARVVADFPLWLYRTGRTPPGVFVAIDTGAVVGQGTDPGFDDLGRRVQLHYYPASDFV